MIRPFGNRLVVKRWPEAEEHESGLWLPSDAREKPQLGDVLAIGTGAGHAFGPWHGIDIRVGEVVVFEKMVSNDFEWTINGEKYLILPYSRIYCAISGLELSPD